MRRVILIAVIVAAVAAGTWFVYQNYILPGQEAESAADADAESIDELQNVIWASGKLTPLQWAELAPENQGSVAEILVAEGDWVEQGDLLLQLDTATLESQVAMAEASLSEAEAALAKLLAGATDAERAAAAAQIAVADARIAQAAGQMLEAQSAIESAEARQLIAEREVGELASHPTAAELEIAKAEVAIAEAGIRQAQAAYNLVRGDPQIGSRSESLLLNQATAALEAANARKLLVEQGATPQQLAVAAGAVDAAAAEVNAARSRGPGAEANVQAAVAELDSAEAAFDKLIAGATSEDIMIAEARVLSAQAAVDNAQAQLQLSQIIAPFAGQIAQINLRPGESTPLEGPALMMGDPGTMHIETTDLRETDVVKLTIDMPVEVTFDALPDQIFRGHITYIAPVSNTEKGSTNYTVHIEVDDLDESLRWGMTAFVNINVEE